MDNRIDVVIDGKVTSLRSDESAEHMQKVALYVDQKIALLKSNNISAAVDERVRTVLIALNLADDYFKIKDRHTALDVQNRKLSQDVSSLKEKNNILTDQVKVLQAELTKVSTEFEEFLRNFDNPDGGEEEVSKVIHLPKPEARKAAK